jgi:hypothetical protein
MAIPEISARFNSMSRTQLPFASMTVTTPPSVTSGNRGDGKPHAWITRGKIKPKRHFTARTKLTRKIVTGDVQIAIGVNCNRRGTHAAGKLVEHRHVVHTSGTLREPHDAIRQQFRHKPARNHAASVVKQTNVRCTMLEAQRSEGTANVHGTRGCNSDAAGMREAISS